jgi:hypothetical protein
MPTLTLSAPKVVRSYVEDSFTPSLSVLCLRWEGEETVERLWELPEGVSILGAAPARLGWTVRQEGSGNFSVRLLWDRTCLNWDSLSHAEILTSCLSPLLSALGFDLWHVLDEARRCPRRGPVRAA